MARKAGVSFEFGILVDLRFVGLGIDLIEIFHLRVQIDPYLKKKNNTSLFIFAASSKNDPTINSVKAIDRGRLQDAPVPFPILHWSSIARILFEILVIPLQQFLDMEYIYYA